MQLVIINDYMKFLDLFSESCGFMHMFPARVEMPGGAVVIPFRDNYHPWGQALNVREMNEIALSVLDREGVSYSLYKEN
jgi:hypothetical protein